jgi:hypothetical protein
MTFISEPSTSKYGFYLCTLQGHWQGSTPVAYLVQEAEPQSKVQVKPGNQKSWIY